ncbi:hypothetical protein RirG_233310 [Rhizophagus irregularis DAOM 197198w]|nr:hypothetical protein RirG_233310 [Rhizophagus irregularis DAOM 197198w]
MQSENADPQPQPGYNSHTSENASDDTQSSTTALTKPTEQPSITPALTGIDQYNDMDETGDSVDNQNTGNNTENQEEINDAAAERVLDNFIKENTQETSREVPQGKLNEAKAEDTDSEGEEVEEEELASGVTPSYEQVNGAQMEERMSLLKRKQRMDEILRQEDGDSEFEDEQMTDVDQEDQESASAPIPEGLCVECRDQEASFSCEQCSEEFCEMCFAMIHRTGNRRNHKYKNLNVNMKTNGKVKTTAKIISNDDMETEESTPEEDEPKPINIISSGNTSFGDWFESRAKFIPLRLNMEERKLLRLLEAALNVSEYTDKIDIISYNSSKTRRMVHQIKDLCSILSGLMVASDYKKGQELIINKSFEDNQEFFQRIFEIGRRHKIMNPEKMRDAYGKLMYMLMDSVIPDVQDMLSFSLVIPIKTVYSFLKERDGLGLLHHDSMAEATKEIIADGKSRPQINQEIRSKERAIEWLSRKFANDNLTQEEIKHCLYSIGDNHAYLRANRDCCERISQYLQKYFNPNKIEKGYSLAISSGRNGARLSHSHEMQYLYANQTLHLWREIQHEMFMLWSLSDQDLLSDHNTYRLRDTGQGLNRVQMCPAVSKCMHSILHRAQQKAGYWVGSSVIHLGDKNVPNALMFIDKYNQVSRILNPILICLESIEPVIAKNTGLRSYVDNSFGGVDALKKSILADFFKYAFDGSGADNFFDAGSCIDGRLTSAWNWCSLIEKKSYFPIFLLTGFVGFDGDGF